MARKNRLYPHLLPDNIELWERWLDDHAKEYTSFDYDVRVGQGQIIDQDLPDNIRRMAMDLSQRRIDAVGHTDSHIDIIEICKSAGLRAIGQMIGYPQLYQELYNPTKPLRRVLVAETLQPDIEPLLTPNQIVWSRPHD